MTDPVPEEPIEPPAEEEPEAEPCTSVYPRNESITCELTVGHFDYRVPHTRHTEGTVYEWE